MLVATFSMRPRICAMQAEPPTMRRSACTPLGGGGAARSGASPNGRAAGGWRWLCSAALTAARSCLRSTGLVR